MQEAERRLSVGDLSFSAVELLSAFNASDVTQFIVCNL